jgi:phage internal scaffolding protein
MKLKAQLDNYDKNGFDKASDETGLKCLDKSLTKQSFAEEADINTIVRKFLQTGELPTNVRLPTYGDFTGLTDYHAAMNAVAQANEAFDQLPANIRTRFHNDPGEFVDFCSDDKNREEAIKLGLVPPPPLELDTTPSVAPETKGGGEVPPPPPKAAKRGETKPKDTTPGEKD